MLSVVNGMVFGGGCEWVFVIDYCVVSFNVKIGLFEVKLGIMFGFGGIVCFLCFIGVDNVMMWIIIGKENCVEDVLKVGVFDVVVSVDKFLELSIVIFE